MEIMSSSSRFPFTSSQWQELEHQALVYKYMISGMPIPPDLLFSIQRSLDSSTRLIMHHHSPSLPIGREYFQMGFGRKIDPEPGRCRRTDGKKWRCSKGVYPDSKYCERHMHRGRNRSRKPVEPTTSSTPLTSISAKSSSTYHPSPFAYPQLSRSPGINNVLSSQDRFLLESSPYSHSEKDHSYVMKEDVDEHHPYLSESGTMSDSWHLEPLAMKSSPLAQSQSKQLSNFSDYQNESYSYQNTSALKQDHGGCYDQLALKVEMKDEPQKVMHHFFDEAPHDGGDHNKDKDSSTTQLSISIPDCAHDFFLAHNDK
ncbi:growth-regulating factor 3-like isoform X2 [Bidens hawaiensis]|uniref:growth-regulating factor 3-like isoform X2 n=1 Tax=Bidens hawaiensis TaxID=980011 RepID=UPI0040490D77